MLRPHLDPALDERLPVAARREEIAAAIRAHPACIVCGATGSGKTTQLPLICLALGRGRSAQIGHTQPRRIAARSVAARIAEHLGSSAGPRSPVGYAVRFDDQSSSANSVRLMTDGVLLAELPGDPDLLRYDTLIIDEAHERSLNIDVLLGYTRTLLERRPDLKVIVTSATIDPARFSNHFGGPERCPIIEVSGRSYPIEHRYRNASRAIEEDFDRAGVREFAQAVEEALDAGRGDVLAFLPGEREIRAAAEGLRREGIDAEILPLYSRLSVQEQSRIFQAHDRPRVILATNVAETSLTIPGIGAVVDTGLARLNRYCHTTKVQGLLIERISRASADQRAGRCGRIGPGVCVRLYSEAEYRERPAFTDPEIHRSGLAGVILRMLTLGLGSLDEFPFVEPPDRRMVRDGYQTLRELGAIDWERAITPLGRALSRLPVDPRIARILLAGAEEGCLEDALTVAAVLSVQDPRERPMERADAADRAQLRFRHQDSDFCALINLWEAYREEAGRGGDERNWCREHFVSFMRMREWAETRSQLREIMKDAPARPAPEGPAARYTALHRALLAGLLSNVACKDDARRAPEYLTPHGEVAAIFPGSCLFKRPSGLGPPKWIVAAEIVETSRLFARTCAVIEPAWVEAVGGHVLTRTHSDVHWSSETQGVCAWERSALFGLTLAGRRRVEYGSANPREAREVFIHKGILSGALDEGPEWARQNARLRAGARAAEAKLRRHDVAASDRDLAPWYDERLPPGASSIAEVERWLAENPAHEARLRLSERDVLAPGVQHLLTPERFPDAMPLSGKPGASRGRLDYALAPGEDRDGVTLTVSLLDLGAMDALRPEWLVPGMLVDKVAALIKGLPKTERGRLDTDGRGAPSLAEQCVELMTFGEGDLRGALSEAVEVVRSVAIAPAQWAIDALPAHLRMRVRVTDQHGAEVAVSRDVEELRTRLAGRIRRAEAGAARAKYQRDGITSWDFGDLPESITGDGDGPAGFPALVDRAENVSLTLASSADAARGLHRAGVQRLFALECGADLRDRFEGLAGWDEMTRHHAPLGTTPQLIDALTRLVVERAFLHGQPEPRTREEYERLQSAGWARLGQSTSEITALVEQLLEHRFRIAGRLASGIPRAWAASAADIREHAAFLMPRGFLHAVGYARLKEYPRYLETVRIRLANLREDGSSSEDAALAKVLPLWKRFTGWVAAASAEAKRQAENAPEEPAPVTPAVTGKSRSAQPLPQAPKRRNAPVIPTDAAEFAGAPGVLPAPLETYRWMLEEFRVGVFAPQVAGRAGFPDANSLEAAWKLVPPAPR